MVAPSFGPNHHEASNEFRVDTVGLGTGATAGGKGFDLGGRQLPGGNLCCIENSPQFPLLPAGSLKADEGVLPARQGRHLRMAFRRIRQPKAQTIRQAVDVQPIARHIYANDPLG